MKNSDMPAMPIKGCDDRFFNFDTDVDKGYFESGKFTTGLSKREHFAAMAMQGLLANEACETEGVQAMADYSVWVADALLAELEK